MAADLYLRGDLVTVGLVLRLAVQLHWREKAGSGGLVCVLLALLAPLAQGRRREKKRLSLSERKVA